MICLAMLGLSSSDRSHGFTITVASRSSTTQGRVTFCKRADKQAHRNPNKIIEDGRKGSLYEDWNAPNIAFQPLVCMQDYQPNSNVSVAYYLLFVSNTFFNMTYDVHENFVNDYITVW